MADEDEQDVENTEAPVEEDVGSLDDEESSGGNKKLIIIIAGLLLLLGGGGAAAYFMGYLDGLLGKEPVAEEGAHGDEHGDSDHGEAHGDDHGKYEEEYGDGYGYEEVKEEEHAGDDHGDDHAEKGGDGHGGDDGHGGAAGGGKYVTVPTMLVNLNTDDGTPRFLRLSVQIELKSKSDYGAVEAVLPRVVDQFQTYLRELRVKDLRGSAGIYRLQMELLWRVNQAAKPVRVKDVLFQEILIQ